LIFIRYYITLKQINIC